jgi:cell division protein FtsZ
MKKETPSAAKQFVLPLDERVEETAEEIKPVAVKHHPGAEIAEAMRPTLMETPSPTASPGLVFFTNEEPGKNTVDKPVENKEIPEYRELVYSQASTNPSSATLSGNQQPSSTHSTHSPASAASGGYLAKPSNIYAEPRQADKSCPEHLIPPVKPASSSEPVHMSVQKEEEPSFDMQLVFKEDVSSAADAPRALPTQNQHNTPAEELPMADEAGEQKRRAVERIQKLRNLSFNINPADANNEFETVPAYIRRNLELYNTVSPAENFYSHYEVKPDENNQVQISTINTFLDGKKPD